MDQQTNGSPTRAPRVLRLDASMRHDGSVSRALTDRLVERLRDSHGTVDVTSRDLARAPVPQVDEAWIGANFTDADARTPEQRQALALSDTLVAELQAADILVLGMPIYNFGVPAALKAWIDMVARARVTFRYTPDGPEGLLTGKRAYIVTASGGTHVDSAIDFAVPYLRHVLAFLGITDVEVIAADGLMMDAGRRDRAEAQITKIAA